MVALCAAALAVAAAGCASTAAASTAARAARRSPAGPRSCRAAGDHAELHLPVHQQRVVQRYQHRRPAVPAVPAAVLVRPNGQPTVNNSLSLANPPMFNGDKVTITLKHYMWSNGTQVTAQDVMFWLNMVLAVPADCGRLHRVPDEREGHHGGQPHRADHGDGQGVLADLVPVQRAEPDHPDAGRVGPDRVRAEQLRHHRQRLRGGLQLPRRPVQGPVHATWARRCGASWTGRGS